MGKISPLIGVGIVIGFIIVSSPNYLQAFKGFEKHFNFANAVFEQNPMVEVVQKEILEIQKREKREKLDFFQFRAYNPTGEDYYVNSVFWVPLEMDFNKRFVRVDDSAYRGYSPLTKDDYIFLWCLAGARNCVEEFTLDNPQYEIIKKIPDYSVYLAKKVF